MSGYPEFLPDEGENEPARSEVNREACQGENQQPNQEVNYAATPGSDSEVPIQSPAPVPPAEDPANEAIGPQPVIPQTEFPPAEKSLFAHYESVAPPPRPPRKPNFGDFLVFALLAFGGSLGAGLVVLEALHYHVLGISTFKQANEEIHYRLGSQALWYLFTLLFCMWVFPLIWRRSFFEGIEWRASAAGRHIWRLVGAAGACFVGAIVDELVIPGPANTPIDQTFRMPGAVWLLFGFGVTLAPLIEEIAYRGFLLPSLCTAYDWMVEQFTRSKPRPPDENGFPRWSFPAMAVGSVLTSIPFALMHGEQTAYSIGPFLLLVSISLVLCWVRLAARSLAASVVVHSSYNMLLFTLMFFGTGGFRHLDKM